MVFGLLPTAFLSSGGLCPAPAIGRHSSTLSAPPPDANSFGAASDADARPRRAPWVVHGQFRKRSDGDSRPANVAMAHGSVVISGDDTVHLDQSLAQTGATGFAVAVSDAAEDSTFTALQV